MKTILTGIGETGSRVSGGMTIRNLSLENRKMPPDGELAAARSPMIDSRSHTFLIALYGLFGGGLTKILPFTI
jgi:hypothetical protein